ncbi:MAG: GatB/YqeY domain-containing protein, partial [Bacteroidales bacterium]
MNLFDQISEDIKKAMLAKDALRTQTLRGIKKEFIEAKTAKDSNGELTDETATRILQKMVKQRKDAAEIFHTQNRQDLADSE